MQRISPGFSKDFEKNFKLFPSFYGRLLAPRGFQEAPRGPPEAQAAPKGPLGGPEAAPKRPREALKGPQEVLTMPSRASRKTAGGETAETRRGDTAETRRGDTAEWCGCLGCFEALFHIVGQCLETPSYYALPVPMSARFMLGLCSQTRPNNGPKPILIVNLQ